MRQNRRCRKRLRSGRSARRCRPQSRRRFRHSRRWRHRCSPWSLRSCAAHNGRWQRRPRRRRSSRPVVRCNWRCSCRRSCKPGRYLLRDCRPHPPRSSAHSSTRGTPRRPPSKSCLWFHPQYPRRSTPRCRLARRRSGRCNNRHRSGKRSQGRRRRRQVCSSRSPRRSSSRRGRPRCSPYRRRSSSRARIRFPGKPRRRRGSCGRSWFARGVRAPRPAAANKHDRQVLSRGPRSFRRGASDTPRASSARAR